MFGGWQVRVIHERAGFRRVLQKRFSHRVGISAARSIVRQELMEQCGDGIYHFVRYTEKMYKPKRSAWKPKCTEFCRVKVDHNVIRLIGPERPATRPCDEFFG